MKLPGEERFINVVCNSLLDDGRPVLVRSPLNQHLYGKLYNRLNSGTGFLSISCLNSSFHDFMDCVASSVEDKELALRFLWQEKNQPFPERNLESIKLLFDEWEDSDNHIFIVHCRNEQEWCAWTHFISLFSRATRDGRFSYDIRFLVFSEDLSFHDISKDYLYIFDYEGYLSPIDMHVYITHSKQLMPMSELEHRVYCSVIAHYAQFDIDLVDYLSDFNLEVLLDIDQTFENLKKYAEGKKWSLEDSIAVKRNKGMVVRLNNSRYSKHSAYYALGDKSVRKRNEVFRRLWAALNESLMPVIDDVRCMMIEKYSHFNWLSQRLDDKSYFNSYKRHIYENDLGDVKYFFKNPNFLITASIPDKQLVDAANKIRTELAHFNDFSANEIHKQIGTMEVILS